MFCAALLAAALAADPAPKPRLDADGIPLPAEALRRFGSLRFCTDQPHAMAFSPDGKTVYSLVAGAGSWVDENRPNLTAWEIATGRRLWVFADENLSGQSIASDPNGKLLWVVGRSAGNGGDPKRTTALRLKLDAATGDVLERKELGNSWSDAHALLADGTLIWNCYDVKAEDLTVRRLKPDGTDVLAWDPKGHVIGLLTLSPDGKTLYAGGRAFDTPMWKLSAVDVATATARWSVDTAMQDTLAVSPDGKVVAMAVSGDPPPKGPRGQAPENERPTTTKIVGRHATTGEEFGAVFVGKDYFRGFQHSSPPAGRPLRFSPDGKELLTMNDNGKTVTIYTEKWEADAKLRDDQAVRGWPAPDGKTYFASAFGYNLRRYNTATHTEIDPPPPLWPLASRHDGAGLRFSPDGQQFLFGTNFTSFVLLDVATGKELERIPRNGRPNAAWVREAGIGPNVDHWPRSRDGKLRLRWYRPRRDTDTSTAEVSDVKSDERVAELIVPDLFRAEFSPDSKWIVGVGRGRRLCVWEVAKGGESVAELTVGIQEYQHHLRVHPTENWMAVAEIEPQAKGVRDVKWQLHRYDFEGLKRVKTWDLPGSVREFTFTRDGRIIGLLGEPGWRASELRSAFVLDPTRDAPFVFKLHTGTHAHALSPDHRNLAVGTARGGVHLYELATGEIRHTFVGLRRGVRELAFSPDGKVLASESPDGPVILWDVKGELTKPAKPDAAGWDAAWKHLTGDDAAKAFAAVRLVAAHPNDAAAELKKRFAEVKAPTVVAAERAVEALRLADTDAAKKLLAEWVVGDAKSPLTAAAKRK